VPVRTLEKTRRCKNAPNGLLIPNIFVVRPETGTSKIVKPFWHDIKNGDFGIRPSFDRPVVKLARRHGLSQMRVNVAGLSKIINSAKTTIMKLAYFGAGCAEHVIVQLDF
jgi:hypothetical protein